MRVLVQSVDDVAAAFVDLLGAMPAMKLEKLVYYAQAWNVAAGRGLLFAEPVEAWANGPVVEKLYRQHRAARWVTSWPTGHPERLDEEAREVIGRVVSQYGKLTGDELSDLTHMETPWKATRGTLDPGARSRRAIPVDAMARYYGGQVLEPEAAVRHAVGNAALEGQIVSAAAQAAALEAARGAVSGDDAVEVYLNSRSRVG